MEASRARLLFFRDPFLQFGPDIYHNTAVECECSPFRLQDTLYVYFMLPEKFVSRVFEDTQTFCHEFTLTFFFKTGIRLQLFFFFFF